MVTTTTLIHLVRAQPVLKKLYTSEMPVREAYRLGVWINAVDIHLTEYEKQRAKVISKYTVEHKEEKDKRVVPQKHATAFTDAMNDLNKTSVSFEDSLKTFTLEQLEKTDLRMTPENLSVIAFLINSDST